MRSRFSRGVMGSGCARCVSDKYILRDRVAVPCEDLLEWGRWLEANRAACSVAHDHVGDYEISTIFMGLDMNLRRLFNPGAPPHLFETMVFSGFQRSGEILAQERCATWDEAETQHRALAARYRVAVNC
jgi:hypothetical protein